MVAKIRNNNPYRILAAIKVAHRKGNEREAKTQRIKDERHERRLARKAKYAVHVERRLKMIEKTPSRMAIKELQAIMENPDTPAFQKVRVSAILLRWMDGDLSDGRGRKRRISR